jgi:hypothetical protein
MPEPLSDTKLGKALSRSKPTIGRWRKAGMPNTSVEGAREWASTNRPHRGPPTPQQEALESPTIVLPEDEDAYATVRRLRLAEREIAGAIEGWCTISLPKVTEERNAAKTAKAVLEAERRITQVQNKIEGLRKEQRVAIKALLEAEQHLVKLEKARGKLVTLDEAKDLITKSLTPVLIAIRKLPDSAQSQEERSRFAAIAESLLSVIRESATAAVSKTERDVPATNGECSPT